MVGAELTKWHGQAPRLRPDKIKSLCEGYHIDNELDHARLLTYTSQRRLICRKVMGKDARDQFFGEYPKPPRINRRQGPRRVLLDRLWLQATNNNNHKSRQRGLKNWRTNNPSNKRPMKLSETRSDEQLSCQCVSRLSSNMTFLSSKRTHLIDWRNTSWTLQQVTGVEALPLLEAREEYIQACLDKTDCKEASVIWDLMYRSTLAEKRLFPQLTEWLNLPRRWKSTKMNIF
jgi:hypothetical protein